MRNRAGVEPRASAMGHTLLTGVNHMLNACPGDFCVIFPDKMEEIKYSIL